MNRAKRANVSQSDFRRRLRVNLRGSAPARDRRYDHFRAVIAALPCCRSTDRPPSGNRSVNAKSAVGGIVIGRAGVLRVAVALLKTANPPFDPSECHRERQGRLGCDSGWTPESGLSGTERTTLGSGVKSPIPRRPLTRLVSGRANNGKGIGIALRAVVIVGKLVDEGERRGYSLAGGVSPGVQGNSNRPCPKRLRRAAAPPARAQSPPSSYCTIAKNDRSFIDIIDVYYCCNTWVTIMQCVGWLALPAQEGRE